MKALVIAAAATIAVTVIGTAPVQAQEWWQKAINDTKGISASAPARTASTASRRGGATRTAAAIDTSERPQRRSQSERPAFADRPITSSGGETGVASYYWQPQRVASGGWFNPNAWTAAHKSLPFGTRVRVTRLDNGNSVDVTINDRGPYVSGRIIDLSRRAAQAIGMTGQGLARVRVAVVGRG
jgi:rare lipoprotein A